MEELFKYLKDKGSVKTNYFDKKRGSWNDNTKNFKNFLEKQGLIDGRDYKIENIINPANHKQRFTLIKN